MKSSMQFLHFQSILYFVLFQFLPVYLLSPHFPLSMCHRHITVQQNMSIVYQILSSDAFSYIFQGSPGRPGAPGLPGLKGEKGDPGELPFSLTVMYAAHYWSQIDLCHLFISQITIREHIIFTQYNNIDKSVFQLCFNPLHGLHQTKQS